MIAHRTYRAVSFLAERVKNRLRFAAPTGRKARRALAHRAIRMRGQTVSDASWPNSAGRRAAQIDTVRSVKFLQTAHSLVVACNKATVPARTNRSGKWQHLRQSQVPQHIKYVLRGTLNVPRAMCNAESTPQRRAQRTHDNALVG